MSETSVWSKTWTDILRHMLGCAKARRYHGFRNHFCANVGDGDYRELEVMAKAGLVTAGVKINQGTSQYFHATKAGCEAIGLHKAAIKRAFSK